MVDKNIILLGCIVLGLVAAGLAIYFMRGRRLGETEEAATGSAADAQYIASTILRPEVRGIHGDYFTTESLQNALNEGRLRMEHVRGGPGGFPESYVTVIPVRQPKQGGLYVAQTRAAHAQDFVMMATDAQQAAEMLKQQIGGIDLDSYEIVPFEAELGSVFVIDKWRATDG